MPAGDLDLFLLGIAGELEHLHAVAQRRRDRIEQVQQSFAAALFFGAGSLVVLAATLSAGLLIAIGELLARWNIPPFYSQVLGGFIAVGGAVLVALIDPAAVRAKRSS